MMADKAELKKLGQFFHDIRTSRGVTLKEAAGNWSLSNLSRFEHGEQDLSTDKAVELMARLGIESDDFYNYYESCRKNFPNIILNYALSYDRKFVEEWRQSYQEAHPIRTKITDYAEVMFDVAIHWHDADYVLSVEQEQILADRLAVPERFTPLEMDILKLIVGPASHELRMLLKQRVERMAPAWALRRDTRLLVIWLGALMAHDMDLADELQAHLAPLFEHEETSPLVTQYYSNWQFGVLATKWLIAPTLKHEQAITTLIDDLLAMGNGDDGFWFKNMFARMQTGTVYHNFGIVDHPRSLVVSHNVAEVIKHQREYLGVGIADIAVGQDQTALRRFEAGETQLGFGALVELMGELAMMPSQVLAFINQSPDRPHEGIGVWPVFVQMPKLSVAAARQKCQEFARQIPNKPAKVWRMQRFILNSTVAGLADDAQMNADAQFVADKLMRANAWYRLELLSFQAVIDWLPTAQLQLLFHHGRRLFEKNAAIYGVTTYFFEGLSKALVHVVSTESHETSQQFVQELKWTVGKNTETPGAWLATGSWLVADAITAPATDKDAKVQEYLRRSVRVGHVEAVTALKKAWQGLVPTDYFDLKAH